MLANGFLCFFNGTLIVRSADACSFFIAYGIEGEHLHVVIFVPLLLCLQSGFISFVSVEVYVITGGQGMVEACTGCVLSGGTSGNKHQSN